MEGTRSVAGTGPVLGKYSRQGYLRFLANSFSSMLIQVDLSTVLEWHLLNPHPFGKTSGSDAKLQLARRFRGKSPSESGILRLVWMWGPALPCRNIFDFRATRSYATHSLLVLADKVPARALVRNSCTSGRTHSARHRIPHVAQADRDGEHGWEIVSNSCSCRHP